MELELLPPSDGDGYEVKAPATMCIGYVYKSPISGKWGAFSKWGRQMSEYRFDTPVQAAHYGEYASA